MISSLSFLTTIRMFDLKSESPLWQKGLHPLKFLINNVKACVQAIFYNAEMVVKNFSTLSIQNIRHLNKAQLAGLSKIAADNQAVNAQLIAFFQACFITDSVAGKILRPSDEQTLDNLLSSLSLEQLTKINQSNNLTPEQHLVLEGYLKANGRAIITNLAKKSQATIWANQIKKIEIVGSYILSFYFTFWADNKLILLLENTKLSDRSCDAIRLALEDLYSENFDKIVTVFPFHARVQLFKSVVRHPGKHYKWSSHIWNTIEGLDKVHAGTTEHEEKINNEDFQEFIRHVAKPLYCQRKLTYLSNYMLRHILPLVKANEIQIPKTKLFDENERLIPLYDLGCMDTEERIKFVNTLSHYTLTNYATREVTSLRFTLAENEIKASITILGAIARNIDSFNKEYFPRLKTALTGQLIKTHRDGKREMLAFIMSCIRRKIDPDFNEAAEAIPSDNGIGPNFWNAFNALHGAS